MCGIIGYYRSKYFSSECNHNLLKRMLDKIHHRGPDGTGVWLEGGLSLGHKRLSILDLSSHGSQPMISKCKRYVIVFNGEIYNF